MADYGSLLRSLIMPPGKLKSNARKSFAMAGRSKIWTAAREALFLDVVRRTGNISAAARAAELPRSMVYEHRCRDQEFKVKLDCVLEEAIDDLEAELRRRAVDGVEKPVFYGGKQCGAVQTYSDNLGMFLLKGRRRSIFGDGKDVTKAAVTDTPDAAQSAMDLLIERLDAMTPPQGGDGCGGA